LKQNYLYNKLLLSGQPGFDFRQGQKGFFFFSPQRPDELQGPPSFLVNAYRGLFPREEIVRVMKPNFHLHLAARLKCVEPYLHSPCLHGVVLGKLYFYRFYDFCEYARDICLFVCLFSFLCLVSCMYYTAQTGRRKT
jgi:hypothetical protein